MTRAVLDPNVLIAWIISPLGAPASLLRSWRLGEFDVVLCPMLMDELRLALAYPRVRQRVSEEEAARLLDSFELAALQVEDPQEVPAVCRDPNDDYLFALASMHADVLVSSDKDIHDVADPGIRVLTPGGFLEILRTRWN